LRFNEGRMMRGMRNKVMTPDHMEYKV